MPNQIFMTKLPQRLLTTSMLIIWVSALIIATAGPKLATFYGLPDPLVPVTRAYEPPSATHLLGTDQLGRDLLARMFNGNSILVLPPAIAAVIATGAGVSLALIASLSTVARRAIKFGCDIVLAIPAMVIVLAVVIAVPDSFFMVAFVSIILSVPLSVRYFEAAAYPVLRSGYVEVARATGQRWPKILLGDVLPALRRPIIADLGVRFVSIVFLSATASFLAGTSGSQEDTWAAMVGTGLSGIDLNPMAVAAPVIGIIALTACPTLILEQHVGGCR